MALKADMRRCNMWAASSGNIGTHLFIGSSVSEFAHLCLKLAPLFHLYSDLPPL